MRSLACLFAFIGTASAAPLDCLAPASWSVPYYAGGVQATSYYVGLNLLAVIWSATDAAVYIAVPPSTAQRFQTTTKGDAVFNQFVKGRYSLALMTPEGCPLLSETGVPLEGGR